MTFDLPTTVYFLKFTYDKLCLKVINLGNYDFPALLVKEEFYLDLPHFLTFAEFQFPALLDLGNFNLNFPHFFKRIFNLNFPHFFKHIFYLNISHFFKHILIRITRTF